MLRPKRLYKCLSISQPASGRLKPRSNPAALPSIFPGDCHHVSQEENVQGDQSGTHMSALHRPTVQMDLVPYVWWPAWVLSHTVLLPLVGILANLHGHMSTWSTLPLLCSSEQRGDSFKWHLILEILTNEAASPEHPGQRAEGRACLGEWVSDWALTAWQASHCNIWSHRSGGGGDRRDG